MERRAGTGRRGPVKANGARPLDSEVHLNYSQSILKRPHPETRKDLNQEEKKEEVDKIVDAAREAAASAGVATFTHAFDEEAKKLTAESKWWFGGIIGCSVVTAGAVIGLYLWPVLPADANTWQIVRNAFMKVSAIAVLLNGLVWCTRMYRARSHQASVNRHRALSLQTFQAFVQATGDPRTRDAVLLAATKSIFANVSTGLVGERSSGEDPSIQIMEIGKHAGDSGGA